MCENTRAGRIPAGRSLDTGPVQAKRRFRSDVKPVGFPAWPWQRGAGKSRFPVELGIHCRQGLTCRLHVL